MDLMMVMMMMPHYKNGMRNYYRMCDNYRVHYFRLNHHNGMLNKHYMMIMMMVIMMSMMMMM